MTSAPFGATAAGVRALVLSAAVVDGVTMVGATRPPRTSDTQIDSWIEEGANRVLIRIPGYEALPPALIDQVETNAKGLVTQYAAALLADAEHPEKVGGAGRLGEAYMTRYQTGLNELATFVLTEIEKLRLSESAEVGSTDFGAAGQFPQLVYDNDPRRWMSRGF